VTKVTKLRNTEFRGPVLEADTSLNQNMRFQFVTAVSMKVQFIGEYCRVVCRWLPVFWRTRLFLHA